MKLPTILKEYVTLYILTITKPHSLIYLLEMLTIHLVWFDYSY